MEYATIKELVSLAEAAETSIWKIVLQVEAEEEEMTEAEVRKSMLANLNVMKEAVDYGRKNNIQTGGGLVGDEALKLEKYLTTASKSEQNNIYNKMITYALATAEVNAGMGKIVAGPTAGVSGIVPAVVLAIGEENSLSDQKLVEALFTAAGLGYVVSRKATLAGAAGGCQAECGVGAAMAAGAAVELRGGSPRMAADAFAVALKNLLGLVCDPVAGLVEVPCVKRNAFAAAHAYTASTMALAGIESVIPADEVIMAMTEIGDQMPTCLKETSRGGLAVTPTALKIKQDL
ncbi:L-serine dehydratase [Halanaerobium saccharolyticum]|uniref:L-serine dehydratase n=1 Tax=Halanaerobium saccharolyticum TaxID=43595 RepID=A0A4R7ZE75_9FIRM|nr:L-serine ammonia-lyase, iron-sulfur-dependent, subunit alpha [Halanaerobium saccharolyticum]RAK09758.1 L-serine dehydratase [Halanaerobium saccharolyticum]TDW07320.1 L-serine dehydratase [Halanaerobium saccharolyticum]TDX61199.1 L-serine dehydratase [Halanaerobium saccharolyticum]